MDKKINLRNTSFIIMLNKFRLQILLTAVIIITLLSLVLNLVSPAFLPNLGIHELVLHFLNYLIFAFFLSLYLHFQEQRSWANKNYFLITFIVLFVFSLFIEFMQYLIPQRGFQLSDISANISGIMVGLLFCRLFSLLVRKKSRIQNL